MPTTSEIATACKVKPNTIRNWTREYAEFLSPDANPPKGSPRIYTIEDAETLLQIGILRADNTPPERIKAALLEGARVDWPNAGEGLEGGQPSPEMTLAVVNRLTAKAANLEGALTAVSSERDNLRQRLEEAQTARETALERAIRAETELQIVKDALNDKRGFWGRLLGR